MKRAIVVAVAVAVIVMSVGSAFAAGKGQMNTGCGLGNMIFGASDENSILLQAFAATTNGTSGNQTFGITSGTSECSQPKNFVSNEKANEFLFANMDNLAKDIAMGKGETLNAYAELLGIPSEHRAEFAQKLQANFAAIFASGHVQYASVSDSIAAAR
jgi:hypothetical protein